MAYVRSSIDALRPRMEFQRTCSHISELKIAHHIKSSASFFSLRRVPPNFPIDTVYYPHRADREYVARFMTWSGNNAALGVSCFDRSEPGSTVVTDVMAGVLLPATFRYLPRKKAPSTSTIGAKEKNFAQSHIESRFRKKFGYLLPFERKEIWRVKYDRQSHLYVASPPE